MSLMKKIAFLFLFTSISIAVLPLVSMITAGLIASLFGCSLDESGTSVCPTAFGDIGELLYMMGVFGWLLFYTVPLGIAGVLISAMFFIINYIRNKKNN